MTNHSDFVKTGLWAGSATELAIRLWERDESKIHLPWTTPLTTTLVWQTTHGTARPPTPPRAYPLPDRDAGRGHGGRDNDRRHDRRSWTRRADGTPLTTPLVWQTTHGTARPPTPRGRLLLWYGRLRMVLPVEAAEDETMIGDTTDKGTPFRTDVITHLSCN
jgi:hypothetical protein